MGLFGKLFGSNKSAERNGAGSANCGGRLNYNPSKRSEYGTYEYNYARFDNGIVYNGSNMPAVPEIIIGYYENDENDNYIVWNMDRNKKVGMIDGATGEVTLSLIDHYTQVRSVRPYVKTPSAMTWKCVKAEHGRLVDLTNGMLIGTYDGDSMGAAAAFVCLSYEYIQDGKYHSYFYDWSK